MLGLEIREVKQSEIDQLRDISIQTFVETFASQNTAENMQKYLENNLSISQLTREITNIHSRFYFAVLDNEIIGYLKINFGTAQTNLKTPTSLEIERIYVLNAMHGKGVGQLMLQKAIQCACDLKMERAWLGVWEKNYRAINFYRKNGFEEFDKHVFKLGDDLQTDIMMFLNLEETPLLN